MKKKKLFSAVKKIESVELLIAKKMMLVSTKNFQVAMLAELWNLYSDDKKKHLCRNIITYCKVNNAFNQIEEKVDPVLLISIKYSNDNVEPFAYFKNGEIELINKLIS